MKPLIAAACVAVIAAVGYFFWGEISESRRLAQIEAGREGARKEIFDFAKAQPHEVTKVRDWCKRTDGRLDNDLKDNELARGVVRNCRVLGYL